MPGSCSTRNDVAGFAAAMRRVAEDDALAAAMRAKALVQALRFDWEQTARALLEACSQAVKRS